MSKRPDLIHAELELTKTQAAMVDEFMRNQYLTSRTAALQVLLSIALETVTSTGQRFWDKPSDRRQD